MQILFVLRSKICLVLRILGLKGLIFFFGKMETEVLDFVLSEMLKIFD